MSQSDLVVVASGADLESANPLTTVHSMARQVHRYALFVTLAQYDSTLTPTPYFAREWRWDSSRTTLRLSLFQGLRWHDGAPTDARDVQFTLDAARDSATGYYRRSELRELSHVTTEGDSVALLHFAVAQRRFPDVLCELPIAPAHLLRDVPHGALKEHPFRYAPVGNGPYRFVERRVGREWRFARNEDFPALLGGPPNIPRFVVAVVDEATTKFAALVSGDVHVAGIAPSMARQVERDPSLRVVTYPVAFTNALIFNTTRAPFDDARVRRAFGMALNRARIVDVALAGFATPAVGAIPPDHPLARSHPPVDHGDSAAILLDQAGWKLNAAGVREKDGIPLRVMLRSVGSGDNALEQLIQADLRNVGVVVEISQTELGAFLAEARSRPKRFDMLVTLIPSDLGLSHLQNMFGSAQADGPLDYTGFHAAALDSLLARAAQGATLDERRRAWSAVDVWLQGAAPVAWVYHARGVQGISRRLKHVVMDLRGELPTLSRWTLEASREP